MNYCEDCGEEITNTQMICEDCCDHDYDPDEGFMCLNCGKQGDITDVYDEDYGQER